MALKTGLVSYWKCDEGTTGNLVDAHGANTGTAVNAPGTTASGKILAARTFNGVNKNFSVTSTAGLSTGAKYWEVAFWYNPGLSAGGVIGKGDNAGSSQEWLLYYDSGALKVWTGDLSAPLTLGTPSLNNWHWIVAGYIASSNTVYGSIDNGTVLSAVMTGDAIPASTADPLLIGASLGEYLSGTMDEIAIWVGATSAANKTAGERTTIYNAGDGLSFDLWDQPEISVTGNSVSIADGDASPSTTDDTDFGDVVVAATADRSYTITNSGNAALTISSCALTGTDAADYSITADPSGSIAAAGTGTLTIRFTPGALGARVATITINSNDADEAAFNFDLQGTGVAASVPSSNRVQIGLGIGL